MSACENSVRLFMLSWVSGAVPSKLKLFFVISNIYKVATNRVATAIAKLN